MANLQTTTVTTFNATTSISASTVLNESTSSIQQWAGYVGIQTPNVDPVNNYADILVNTNGYAWINGYVSIPANQSYNTAHDFWFALSLYGLKIATGVTWDGLMGVSTWTSGNNSYLRITNNYNAPWAFGNYHVNVTAFTGNSKNSITSSVLTRIN
jgi:hypothetical protein